MEKEKEAVEAATEAAATAGGAGAEGRGAVRSKETDVFLFKSGSVSAAWLRGEVVSAPCTSPAELTGSIRGQAVCLL